MKEWSILVPGIIFLKRKQCPAANCFKIILLASIVLFSIWHPLVSADEFPKQILMITSYHQGDNWNDSIVSGVQEVFDKYSKQTTLFIEYLDIRRNDGEAHVQLFFNYLKGKYATKNLDLIILSDDAALDFFFGIRSRFFGDVPAVFCGINNFKPEILAGHSNITGVNEEISIAKTMEMAFHLFPDTRNIVAVCDDKSAVGKSNLTIFRNAAEQFKDRAGFSEALNLIPTDVHEVLGKLSPGTLLFRLNNLLNSEGNFVSIQETMAVLSTKVSLPIFTAWDFDMGLGAIGGVLVSAMEQGRKAAAFSLQILEGASADHIPIIRESPNIPFVDYEQIRRFGLTLKDLPEGVHVINFPDSLWEKYKYAVIFVLCVSFLLMIIVVLQMLHLKKRYKIENALESEQRFLNAVFDNIEEAIVICDENGTLVRFNEAARKLHGLPERPIKPQQWSEYYSLFREDGITPLPVEEIPLYRALQGECVRDAEIVVAARSSRLRHLVCNGQNLKNHAGKSIGAVVAMHDDTQRRMAEMEHNKLQAQLNQAQKMESIGRLAGGIAHEFNNILSIIIGNNDLIMEDLPEWSLSRENCEEIRLAGLRARDIVKHLLTFSRHDVSTKKPIETRSVVKESLKLIRSTTPANIEIRDKISPTCRPIYGDSTQINQILINLCSNAIDALPISGGKIDIELGNTQIEKEAASSTSNLEPGEYIKLQVRDNGIGMKKEMIDRIFEPYFTTKDVGKGSGIGLAVVHGIVKNHGGAIVCDSTVGQGTIFTILIPAYDGPVKDETDKKDIFIGNGEKILYVDDEPSIAKLGRRHLESIGYDAYSTTDPSKALEMIKVEPDRFDLVITDMAMPGMPGDQLITEILHLNPNMPTIICTGYSSRMSETKASEMGVSAFVMKPLNKAELAKKVRQVLDDSNRTVK